MTSNIFSNEIFTEFLNNMNGRNYNETNNITHGATDNRITTMAFKEFMVLQ